jgi:hypothetical protein
METYSQVAGVMVFVLVAALFILLLILNDPKYESVEIPVENERNTIIEHPLDLRFEPSYAILSRLNFLFYSTICFS